MRNLLTSRKIAQGPPSVHLAGFKIRTLLIKCIQERIKLCFGVFSFWKRVDGRMMVNEDYEQSEEWQKEERKKERKGGSTHYKDEDKGN